MSPTLPRCFAATATAFVLLAVPAGAPAATANPAGKGCDPIDPAACLLPFPNDSFTVADAATGTGRRLKFAASEMPRNAKGTPIDPRPYAKLDGFSPGSVILAKVPGLDTPGAMRRTDPVGLSDISRFSRTDAPVLVLDTATGKRWPVWAELDVNAANARDRLLEIHPAKNLAEGRRYVVVLRDLRRADGSAIRAGRAFAALRDGRRHSARYDRIFRSLKRAHVKRDRSLFLAWDFTVASEQSLTGRMLHIRNDAFAQLGDRNLADLKVEGRSPAFAVSQVEDFTPEQNPHIARRVTGTITVPCYLDRPGCPPGSRFHYARTGDFLPSQLPGNTYAAPLVCVIPRAASATAPARVALYGHGLLGSTNEVNAGNVALMADEHDFVFCATNWIGMSSEDIPNAISVLGDLSGMPSIADRLQQGMLDALYLGRAMIHPGGLVSDPAFQQGGSPLIDTGRLYYDGNSQGGVMGGALTPFAPDYTRAVLGVPGMNYGVLLPRSSDFDTYSKIVYPAYPDQLERPLVLDIAQILWDRGEADGVAAHMTRAPLPGTPAHEVLLQTAFGDHQVTTFQADVEARTIGASMHQPALAPGRSPQHHPFWGIPAITSYPFAGSAMVVWDSGPARVGAPPLTDTPNRSGADPHEDPRATPAARTQKSEFLKPDGMVVDACGGAPCQSIPAP
ncbi:MAG: hypothetical protein JWO74_2334 [Solirubrobacterales bacterium]|nr:hypothetical protein [Solirubrobacterales bacterium]